MLLLLLPFTTQMMKTSKVYIRDCTTVSPFALALFGGILVLHHEHQVHFQCILLIAATGRTCSSDAAARY
jgi:hypothetical protein